MKALFEVVAGLQASCTLPGCGFLSTCAPPTPWKGTFATVRNRSKVTKGPGSRASGLAMAFKLIEAHQARWPAVNVPHLVALVRAGTKVHNGKLVERPDAPTTADPADAATAAEAAAHTAT